MASGADDVRRDFVGWNGTTAPGDTGASWRMHDRLVIGFDGSDASMAALAWAVAEAERRDAAVRIVSSYAPSGSASRRARGAEPFRRHRCDRTRHLMITSSTQGVRAVLSAVRKCHLSWCFAKRRVERCYPLTSEFGPFVDIPWTRNDTEPHGVGTRLQILAYAQLSTCRMTAM